MTRSGWRAPGWMPGWAEFAYRPAAALASRGRAMVYRRANPDSLGGQVVLNSGWLMAERFIRMGLGFVVTIWVIRYLEADAYGVLAYALSLTLLVDVIATMGMRSIVVRELVEDPEREPEILGTTLGVKFGTAVIAAALMIGFGWLTASGSEVFPVLTVLALALPISALSALDLSFQASLQSQYAVAARTSGLALAALVRVVLLLVGAPLIAFAIASAIELGSVGLAFAGMYAWKRGRRRLFALRFRRRRAWSLISVSWPLFLSALAASVYLKIDQVMLHALTSSREVGQYAAAARLSEIWYFIPVALASSLLPMLVIRRAEDAAGYRSTLQRAFDVNAWMAIALAGGITVVAIPAVAILYGPDFRETANILMVHVWAAPFIFMGTVLGRALIAEDRRAFELSRHTAGALLNVTLNFLLIPGYGGMGAAVATVTSYAFASYFACFFYSPARFHMHLMTRALLWPVRLWRRPSSRGGPGGDGPPEMPGPREPVLWPDEPPAHRALHDAPQTPRIRSGSARVRRTRSRV
ncbi:MAG: flippase [Dehalococcoidia bacterium]|nr:flippase [Dehalococcoidia bacterium]